MTTRVLINTPCLKLLGGVSNHYLGLENKWKLNVVYNTIGRRNSVPTIILLPFDIIKFLCKCLFFKPDVVVLNPSLGLKSLRRDSVFLQLSKLMNIKTVIFFHGWDLTVEQLIERKKYDFVKNFKSADLFLVLAYEFKSKLLEWGITSRIELTTTKVDDDLISTFNIGHKDYNTDILFLSRIEKAKGIFIVLETYKKLVLKYPKLKLTIAGDGSALNSAKAYVKRENLTNVRFLGRVSGSTLIGVLKKNSIFFFPSYSEGMPTSVLEAMAFGQIVITRPVGGIKDFFTSDMGYLANSLESDDFYEVLDECMNIDKIKKIGTYNHYYAVKNFRAAIVSNTLENYFVSILQ